MSLRYVAFYLPQFHPFPENDAWWGKGFTEWRNVARAKPLYDGHNQPRYPADLGYYDLRVPETRHAQVEMAKSHGIDAFCFHYYWFDGKRLMDRPVDAFLADSQADIQFCFCWANENWTRRWDAAEHEVLIAQTYGPDWDLRFIADMIPYFKDPRYLRVNGKPLLIVYRPQHIPDARAAGRRWREYCREAGIGEIHIVSALVHGNWDYRQYEFDAGVEFPPHNMNCNSANNILKTYETFNGYAVEYANVARNFLSRDYKNESIYRTVFPDWDNTARVKDRALIVLGSSVANYERWLRGATSLTRSDRTGDEQLVFINAWNEWAEGCYLEPDLRHGTEYLAATQRVKNGASWLSDIYDIAPERIRSELVDGIIAPETHTASIGAPHPGHSDLPLKFRVAHALHKWPRAFRAAQLVYRAGKRIASPARTTTGKVDQRDQAPLEITEDTARPLEEVALQSLPNVADSKSAFLSSDRDIVWEAYPQARVTWNSEPELIIAKGTQNGPALREMRSGFFDAYPMLFGRFFDCIAHPRAVAVIDSDGRLIAETARVYKQMGMTNIPLDYIEWNEDELFQKKLPQTKIDADVIISIHASWAFGHVIFDALPQILIFSEEIKTGILKILIHERMPNWYPRLLQDFGFDIHHFLILPGNRNSYYRFRSAIVSNSLTTYSTFFPNPKTIASYEESLGARIPVRRGDDRKLIYLARPPESVYSGRVIGNEEELLASLSEHGFHVVDPAKLPYAEQISLFREADIIVGAHGSALANLIWCRPRTKVIDLMPDSWVNFWGTDAGITEYWAARICALKDIDYSVILCKSQGSTQWNPTDVDYHMESFVDIELLNRKIDSILSMRHSPAS